MAKAKVLKRKSSLASERGRESYSPGEARERFEHAVDFAVATKPVHRAAKKRRKARVTSSHEA
jgi:hypothetical protein